ncbi:MAG TPA: magnesium chelatase ATPase subunit I [Blastocatellia bacterium]|nr:magnesium chelatase ATPase subunit I [Blastocatellia bacterium]
MLLTRWLAASTPCLAAKAHSEEPPIRKKTKIPENSGLASPVYPFAAIVGQEEMKLALLLSLIDPHIGGVLIMGHRGTGKSTAVRSLAGLLPRMAKVEGCLYGCDPESPAALCGDCRSRVRKGGAPRSVLGAVPVVDLPLGATEDRVCGTLDIERALTDGVKAFEPGLLARANRGFLYIDEVNLLDDHLVDVLLDVAASGWNVVEREGVSIRHPARFVLVGSCNPEEGELRPQLLDRFGLHAEIHTITDLDQRVEIVERREAFERNPVLFCEEWKTDQQRLRRRLVRANDLVQSKAADRPLLRKIAEVCLVLGIDGHRGELTIARSARALAALDGRSTTTESDVRRVAAMALRHRLRKDPLDSIDSGVSVERALDRILPQAQGSKLSRAI